MGLIETITVDNISAYFESYESRTVIRDKNKEVYREYKLPIRILTSFPGIRESPPIYRYIIINDKIMLLLRGTDWFEIFLLTNNRVDMYQDALDEHCTLNDIIIQSSGIVTEDVMFKYYIGPSCKIGFGLLFWGTTSGEYTKSVSFDIYTTVSRPITIASEKEAETREVEISIPSGVTQYTTYFDVNLPFVMSIKRGLQELLSSYNNVAIIAIERTSEGFYHETDLNIVVSGDFCYMSGFSEDCVYEWHYAGFYIIRDVTEIPDKTPIVGVLNNYHIAGNMFAKRRVQISPRQTFEAWFERR